MEPFTAEELLTKVDGWRAADYVDSLDRAELSRHFCGGSLDPNCDQGGLVGSTNFLLGHRFLAKAYSEHFAIYSRGRGFVDVQVRVGVTEERRRYVEAKANAILNRVIKESRRLRYPYAAVCGDGVLYGTPFLWKWDKTDWCPKYAGKPLMPRDAPADVHDERFILWAFKSSLTPGDLLRQLKRMKGRKREGRWKAGAIRALLNASFAAVKKDVGHYSVDDREPEEIEYDCQSNAVLGNVLQGEVPVYFVFHKRTDKDRAIDVYIVNRLGEVATVDESGKQPREVVKRKDGPLDGERLLYYEAGRFDSVDECLFPFLLDTNLGGEPLMHRITGLGMLNYDIDVMVGQLINVGLAGVEDDFTPLYQATDSASVERLEQMMQQGIRRNGVLPADLTHFERGTRTKNYAHLFAFTQLFTEQQGMNAAAYAGSGGGGRGPRELEVEALERQAEQSRAVTNRMTAWLEAGDTLVQMMVRRLLSGGLMESDKGWPEAKRVRDELAAAGIAREELDEELITVRMQRLPGGGDQGLALQRASQKLQAIQLYPPESQQKILREWTEAVDDSPERAIDLVPVAEQQDPGQVQAAQTQNAIALSSGTVPPINAGDVPGVHVRLHLQPVQAMLEAGGLDVVQARGALALLQHASLDGQLLAAADPATGREVQRVIAELASAVQAVAQQQQPGSPEQVRALQAQQRLALDERKQAFRQDQFAIQQDHRERQAATERALRFNQEARADDQFRVGTLQRQEEIGLKRAALVGE